MRLIVILIISTFSKEVYAHSTIGLTAPGTATAACVGNTISLTSESDEAGADFAIVLVSINGGVFNTTGAATATSGGALKTYIFNSLSFVLSNSPTTFEYKVRFGPTANDAQFGLPGSFETTNTITITINPLPTATLTALGGINTACQNASSPTVNITGVIGTAPFTFTYRITDPSLNITNHTVVSNISGTAQLTVPTSGSTGTYTYELLTVQDASSTTCTNASTATLTMTINPNPTILISPSNPEICQGTSSFDIQYLTTNSPDRYSIQWAGAAITEGFPDVNISMASANLTTITGTIQVMVSNTAPAGTYSGTLTVRNNATMCSFSGTAQLVVNPLPVLGTITGVSPVCVGSTINLSNSLSGGSWTVNNANSTIGISSGVLTGSAAGTSIVSYSVTNVSGCSSLTSTTVTVNALPTVNAITGVSPVCVGSTINLTSTTPSGFWSVNNANAGINVSGTLTGQSAGIVNVSYTVTDGNSCTNLTSTTVTVNALPTVNAITGVSPVCIGSTINLTSTTPSGIWSVNNANALINVSGTLTGQSAGTVGVSYTVTDGNSCTNLTSTTVTVNALPTVNTITGVSPVCIGSTINLTSTTPSGIWSVNNANALINVSGTLTGQSAGTVGVSYTVTDGNSCTNLTSTTVTVNALPTVNAITGVSPVCIGSTINLTSTTPSGIWSVNNANALINVSGTLTGQSAGTVNVSYTVTDGNSCTNLTSTTVTVNALPTVNAITGVSPVCIGSTINLTSTTPSGIWSVNNANAGINVSGTLTGQSAGTVGVSYTVTDGNSCTNLTSTTVTVNALPTVNAITGVSPVCIGSTINLTSTTPSGIWSVNNANALINVSGTLTGQSAGTVGVSYTVTDGNSCTNLTSTTVTVNALPTVNAITGVSPVCIGSTINLTSTTPSGIWSVNNANAGINVSGTLTGQSAGTVSVSYTVTDGNSCTNLTSTTVTVNALPTVNAITGVNPVCIGSTINLTSTTPSGIWSVNNANAGINVSGTLTGQSAGTVSVSYTVTDGNSCTNLTSTTVTVNALPTVNAITGVNPVCVGSTLNLTSTTPSGIWSVNNANAGINVSGTLTGQSAGTVSVSYTVTDGNSCTNLTSTIVTINGLPVVNNITGASAVCINSAVSLTNTTSGGVWSVNNTNATISNTGILTGQSAGTTIVSYSVTDGNNCTTTVTSPKTINALPTVASITGPAAVCIGSTINLANTTNGGIWSVNNANASISNAGELTGQSAGTTIVSYSVTDGNNCTTTVTSSKTINALPTVASITGPAAVCIGSTINLANTTNGGIWSINNANASISSTGVLTGQSAGTTIVSYSVTDGNNCTTTITSSKTINALPIVATITGPADVCIGSAINLANTTTGGIWSVNNANASISNAGVLTGQSAGTTIVSYSVTDGNSCTTTVTSSKTINVLPTANIIPSGLLTFCTGGSVNLNANTGAGLNYLWSNGSTGAAISNITSSGTYTVTVTNQNNCSATSAPVTITVNAIPNVTITNPAAVCAPGTVDLTAAGITAGSTAGLSYSYWTNAAATQSLNTPFAIGTAGTYYIKGSNTATNCASIRPVIVSINPQAAMQINTPAPVCAPGTVDLTATAITNGSAAGLSYTYFTNAAATNVLANPNAVSSSGVYYIKGTPATGCSAIVPVTVTINALPTLTVNNPAAVCSPQVINLMDASITAGSSSGLNFAYFSNASLTTPVTNAQNVNNSGIFYIRATDAITGCFRVAPVTVQINAAPQGTLQTPSGNIICENSSLTLNASGANSYQWLLNQQPINGATTANFNATEAGIYAVKFISAQGCETVSSNTINLELLRKPTVQFTVSNACAGVTANFSNTSITSASGGINWLWDFGDGVSSNLFSPGHIYTTPGNYMVRLTATSPICTGFNETSLKTYTVQSAAPGIRYKDVEVLKDIPVTVQARNIGTSYVWSPSTGVNNSSAASPSIRVNVTTDYTVAITNDIGCTTVDSVLIKVIPGVDIYVPKGFSPNNDGQNDRLYPILVGMRQLNYFRVFNRWGNMIFTTKDSAPQSGWNGLYLGVIQPTGTYTWIAEAVDLQGNIVRKTGTVLLLQ